MLMQVHLMWLCRAETALRAQREAGWQSGQRLQKSKIGSKMGSKREGKLSSSSVSLRENKVCNLSVGFSFTSGLFGVLMRWAMLTTDNTDKRIKGTGL